MMMIIKCFECCCNDVQQRDTADYCYILYNYITSWVTCISVYYKQYQDNLQMSRNWQSYIYFMFFGVFFPGISSLEYQPPPAATQSWLMSLVTRLSSSDALGWKSFQTSWDRLQIKCATSSSQSLFSVSFLTKCFPFLLLEKVVGNSKSGWSVGSWSRLLMLPAELGAGSGGLPFEWAGGLGRL